MKPRAAQQDVSHKRKKDKRHMNNKKCVYVPTSSPEDWKKLLAKPEHWRTGYSARSLAYCWEEANGIPKDVVEILLQISDFKDIKTLMVIPEHRIPLPGGDRPSQNDCWVLARTSNELVSITVEGKVSEPFGPTVGEWLKDASPGKNERLSFLCSELGLDTQPPEHIRYQLLHRTASAVIEAKRFHAKRAIMVVHSFSQTAEWFDDYKEFAALFGAQANVDKIVAAGHPNDINLYLAWVSGDEQYLKM